MNRIKGCISKRTSVLLVGLFLSMVLAALALGQEIESPWVWGPNLGAIGEDFVAISWNTLRAVEVDLHYSTAAVYDATEVWEETLTFEPHKGVAEIRLGNLKPGTTYRYRIVIYEGDAIYPSPVGHFTTSSRETRSFSFLVYGDTRTFPDRHKLVADRMAEDEPNAVLVVNTGDLVESPTIGRFENFFWAVGDLARAHPYLAVLGNHEKRDALYYEFLSLPSGGGESGEEWWSFDYGDVHFLGLDVNALTGEDVMTLMQEQVEWARADLADSNALFKVVFFHYPIYSSTWEGGVNESLRELWEPIFLENGVDVVFNGHMHCYEHFYVKGIHYIVTGGGGAPLQDSIDEAAAGTISRRYGMLHYMRVTVAENTMQVEVVPVASVYNDEVHPLGGQSPDSFAITKTR